jgi:hypothetical protein
LKKRIISRFRTTIHKSGMEKKDVWDLTLKTIGIASILVGAIGLEVQYLSLKHQQFSDTQSQTRSDSIFRLSQLQFSEQKLKDDRDYLAKQNQFTEQIANSIWLFERGKDEDRKSKRSDYEKQIYDEINYSMGIMLDESDSPFDNSYPFKPRYFSSYKNLRDLFSTKIRLLGNPSLTNSIGIFISNFAYYEQLCKCIPYLAPIYTDPTIGFAIEDFQAQFADLEHDELFMAYEATEAKRNKLRDTLDRFIAKVEKRQSSVDGDSLRRILANWELPELLPGEFQKLSDTAFDAASTLQITASDYYESCLNYLWVNQNKLLKTNSEKNEEDRMDSLDMVLANRSQAKAQFLEIIERLKGNDDKKYLTKMHDAHMNIDPSFMKFGRNTLKLLELLRKSSEETNGYVVLSSPILNSDSKSKRAR